MRRGRRAYYDTFSRFYDRFVALHSRDKTGLGQEVFSRPDSHTERLVRFSTSAPVPVRFSPTCRRRSALMAKSLVWIFPTAC